MKLEIGPSIRVQVARDVHVRDFDGELVILDLANGDYFGVNEIGARLWHGLILGKSCEEIAGELGPEYDVPREELVSDLVKLTQDFITRGLVTQVPGE